MEAGPNRDRGASLQRLLPVLNFLVLMLPAVLGARELASQVAIEVSDPVEVGPRADQELPTPPALETTGEADPGVSPPPRSGFADPLVGYGP